MGRNRKAGSLRPRECAARSYEESWRNLRSQELRLIHPTTHVALAVVLFRLVDNVLGHHEGWDRKARATKVFENERKEGVSPNGV